MKNIFILLIAIGINFPLIAQQKSYVSEVSTDSTLHQRFIRNLLQEHNLEGRWLFVKVDSLFKLKNNYEVISPQIFYDLYVKYYINFEEKQFISDEYQDIIRNLAFERYGNEPHPIKGVKVNMKLYKTLLKQPKEKILSTYFNADKTLKKVYKKWLYELIAVCYTNNVKVITPSNAQPYYEVFK